MPTKNYNAMTQEQLNQELFQACCQKDIDAVKYLLESAELIQHGQLIMGKNALVEACIEAGDNDLFNYLLAFPHSPLHKGLSRWTPTVQKIAQHHQLAMAKMVLAKVQYVQEIAQMFFFEACFSGAVDILNHVLTDPVLKSQQSQADLHAQDELGLHYACENGHLAVVQYLLTSPSLQKHAHLHAQDNKAVMQACIKGHLDIVQYLLDSPDILAVGGTHARINASSDKLLKEVCKAGHLPILQLLVNHPRNRAKASAYEDCLVAACEAGSLGVVQYLLTSPEMIKKFGRAVNLHHDDDLPLRSAFHHGHQEVIKFLLESPLLKEHANIHAKSDYCFYIALHNDSLELVRYLVLEYGIKQTQAIDNHMQAMQMPHVKELFTKRSLNHELHESLPVNGTSTKSKVKI